MDCTSDDNDNDQISPSRLLGAPVPSFVPTIPQHLRPVPLHSHLQLLDSQRAAKQATQTKAATTATTVISPDETSLPEWQSKSLPPTPRDMDIHVATNDGDSNSTCNTDETSTTHGNQSGASTPSNSRHARRARIKRYVALSEATKANLLGARQITGCIMCSHSKFDLQLVDMAKMATAITEWVNIQISLNKFSSIFVELQSISNMLCDYAEKNGIILQPMTNEDWLNHFLVHDLNPLVACAHEIQTHMLIKPHIENGLLLADATSRTPVIDTDRLNIKIRADEHLMRLRKHLSTLVAEWMKNGRDSASAFHTVGLPSLKDLRGDDEYVG